MGDYTKKFKVIREGLSHAQKKVNMNVKDNNYNLTEEKQIKAKLKKIQSLISDISHI